MRIHGWIFAALCGVTHSVWAQDNFPPPSDNFLPPSPTRADSKDDEPQQLPGAAVSSDAAVNLEAEFRQLRNQLREFQLMREELTRATKLTELEADKVSSKQRQDLLDMLTKLTRVSVARKAAAAAAAIGSSRRADVETEFDTPSQAVIAPHDSEPSLPPEPPPVPGETEESSSLATSVDAADAFSLGKVLFRTGDFIGAERAFRKASVSPENEMTLKYLLATCLRRQSRWKPALEAYKVVAESNQDPVLRDLAKWQLDNIRWQQQSESQLEQMRKTRENPTAPRGKRSSGKSSQ
ncbi:CDC27 family protein [Schlesneria paludicola]|uniref:CDC27 family protein n=1 Tax=Schlesneria paludicola TaxID=360056 RepID=UPI00029AF234|nr:CDC27 family protein [Schlesneria paludicola]